MTDKRRVLFVDDDPALLRGLRRMLSGIPRAWDMEFVESGQEALKILELRSFDVLVTDMQMPGMSGVTLLETVKVRFPQIARIVLSGHSEQEGILQVVGPAHQYLSKPCTPEALYAKLARTLQLRQTLGSSKLHKVAAGISTLPSMPLAYKQLLDGLSCSEASVDHVAAIVSRDIAFSAKILQVANSEFFGLAQKISDPKMAVHYLGLETIRALTLGVNLFKQTEHTSPLSDFLVEIWRHSIITAVFARRILQVEGAAKEAAEQAFTAGLMHDLGKIIIAEHLGAEYRCGQLPNRGTLISSSDQEYAALGTNHAELGAYLLGLWGLPDPILEAVAYHHTPDSAFEEELSPLTAVHVADHLEHSFRSGEVQSQNFSALNRAYLKRIGYLSHLEDWRVLCQVTIEQNLSRELIDLPF